MENTKLTTKQKILIIWIILLTFIGSFLASCGGIGVGFVSLFEIGINRSFTGFIMLVLSIISLISSVYIIFLGYKRIKNIKNNNNQS